MMETVLVLPFILLILSLSVFFGFTAQRVQRSMMMDRYEAWRGAARAPGPQINIAGAIDVQNADAGDTFQMRATFFDTDAPATLGIEASDYFPLEAYDELEDFAGNHDTRAARLSESYFQELPRGRSMRFIVRHDTAIPLWNRLIKPIRHRHTVMDTDWRYTNAVLFNDQWFDTTVGIYRDVLEPDAGHPIPIMGPGPAVRETFLADFDRRVDPYAVSNPLAARIQSFYNDYPVYRGPTVPTDFDINRGWY